MLQISKCWIISAISAAILSSLGGVERAQAQTYPIDCAILLCLSSGWPVSAPCSSARAEFIRRITPWPVEPPLQIWRCPMSASHEPRDLTDRNYRSYGILADELTGPLPHSSMAVPYFVAPESAIFHGPMGRVEQSPEEFTIQSVQRRADIDISRPEFDFVRSIRVYDVRYAEQRESGVSGDCNRSAVVVLGTYGVQGEFTWQGSSLAALPEAHTGLERWGDHCTSISHRSVFVDWRDYEGNYGFEQVNY